MQLAASQAPVPKPRSPRLALDETIPRHWFGGNAFATHLVNGVNLLFPEGERFFVRSVHRYESAIRDPALLAQIRGFSGQEGRHAREHERFFQVMEAQGFEIRPFLRFYEKVAFGIIERLSPPALRLATTAASEHFTATLAENVFQLGLLAHAHPALRDLLTWHAAEEIEHRAVAFDVLAKVAPSYPLRMAGLALATACLGGFWAIATVTLLRADDEVTLRSLLRDVGVARSGSAGRRGFLHGIRSYARRDFHPRDMRIDKLAADYLKAAGLD